MFADDLKIYLSVSNLNDCTKVQADLDKLLLWCSINKLSVNVDKCKSMSYFMSKSPLVYNYTMNGSSLERVNKIKDLGILFDNKLKFDSHIDVMVAKARSSLGFICRFGYEFTDPLTLKSLYCALVRSKLEYASPVWAPHYNKYKNKIESVQKRFLLFALRFYNWGEGFVLPPYEDRCQLLSLQTLEQRRVNSDLIFISDAMRGTIKSPEIYDLIKFNKSCKVLRHRRLLDTQIHRTNYGHNAPINRMSMLLNNCSCFNTGISRKEFKRSIYDHKCSVIVH